MERYHALGKVGEGTYGVVYKATDKFTGDILALKRIRLIIDDDAAGVPSTALREIAILNHLKHPNIVNLHDVIHEEKRLTLVFEFVEQDLKQLITDSSQHSLDPFMIKSMLFQLLQGIAYCHRNRVLHRDLKPQNILVSSEGIVKIADFGLARPLGVLNSSYAPDVVTLWYRAPELLLGCRQYSTGIDMWSVGCIFAEMVNSTPLFTGGSDYAQLRAIFSVLGTPTATTLPWMEYISSQIALPQFPPVRWEKVCPRLSSVGLSLLKGLLEYDPSKRLSAHEALAHPFFSDLKLQRAV